MTWWDFKALCRNVAQSSLVEEERLDASSLEFWQLVADDLC